jgi:hypothetical protein
VPVEQGAVVCIHGWVNVPQALTGSVDGLLIVDSFGGEALAERIVKTKGWREITLYRAAARGQPLAVTFALTGLGEAWLDDFSVQVLAPRAGERQEAQQPAQPKASLTRR